MLKKKQSLSTYDSSLSSIAELDVQRDTMQVDINQICIDFPQIKLSRAKSKQSNLINAVSQLMGIFSVDRDKRNKGH